MYNKSRLLKVCDSMCCHPKPLWAHHSQDTGHLHPPQSFSCSFADPLPLLLAPRRYRWTLCRQTLVCFLEFQKDSRVHVELHRRRRAGSGFSPSMILPLTHAVVFTSSLSFFHCRVRAAWRAWAASRLSMHQLLEVGLFPVLGCYRYQ